MDAKLERKIFDLSHAASEGIATEDQIQELETYLREDREARTIYLQVMDLHFDLDRQSMIGSLAPEDNNLTCELMLSELDGVEETKPKQNKIIYWMTALAACLAVGLILTQAFSKPGYEAVVLEGSGKINNLPIEKGVRVHFHDKIDLENNQNIKLEFTDNTVVEMDGPTSAVLEKFNEDGRELKLTGEYEQADKFLVSSEKTRIQLRKDETITRKIKVIEEGSAFAIKVEPKYTEVHVFEGMVTSFSNKNGLLGESQTLNQLQAAQFNKKGSLKSWTVPDFEGFNFDRKFDGVMSTNRNVHFISKMPSSLKEGGLESNSSIFLIPEKKGVFLENEIKVSFKERLERGGGTQSAFKTHIRPLKGVKVDSYLLHFDPAEGKFLDGEIVFDRPILALICNAWQLDNSDKYFAVEGVEYPRKNYRGIDNGRPEEANDVLIFTRNPKSIRARFNVKTNTVDQMRILVLSEDFQ